jgi:hypothetical protein
MNTQKSYRYFDLIPALFVVLIVSNVASSAKIVDWASASRPPLARRRHAASSHQLHLRGRAGGSLRLAARGK